MQSTKSSQKARSDELTKKQLDNEIKKLIS